jgi:solute:Na+ symporter, SSS family
LDFYLPLRPETSETRRMVLSRLATIMWAVVLFTLAVLCLHRVARVVELGLQIASISYGALLGVFLLGILTHRTSQLGAMVGMICAIAAEIYVWRFTAVAWTWYVAIGTAVAVVSGYLVSVVLSAASRSPIAKTGKLT